MTEKKWSDGDLDMHRTVKEKKGVKSQVCKINYKKIDFKISEKI